jgi:DNA-binding winged helix-turn-helix (wHTH) protein/Tfp pilus assembly protein PilF
MGHTTSAASFTENFATHAPPEAIPSTIFPIHVPPGTIHYRFGPFHFDPGRRRLLRGPDERVWLPDRSLDVLALLVSRPGQIVSNDDLTRAIWTDFNVGDNTIVKALSVLRQALGRQANGEDYITTHIRKGYRFIAPIETVEARADGRDPDAVLEPHRAFIDGRIALETMNLDAVERARDAFAGVLRQHPDFAAAHIGLASACVLRYESTRADVEPDRAALDEAEQHARAACRLNSSSGHAWSVFALVRHGQGVSREAMAAAREAVRLQPEEWRHHLQLAYVSWGGDRLSAACEALRRCPQLALAQWLAATVYIARGTPDKALEHLTAGCAAQDAQRRDGSPFAMVGLHLLHAVVLADRGSLDAAHDELERERALDGSPQIYARECAANTAYTRGVLALRADRQEEAHASFQLALERVPGHPLARLALHGRSALETRQPADAVARATVEAAALTLHGQHESAARVYGDALVRAEPGPSGWLLPVEPLLHVSAHRDAWAPALAVLRDRAV